ncbi:acetylglutamate kinase [Dictyostelium discoideum AX4]|uniref:Acetylglutamate kinase n=1 Tax=Dictyostelium discoideum TaxID=44689 RepID=Q555V8_DICDI|nr:acetylglutamate kinase [Dictyostelium discoideum AX4]EAL70298.2 acetylglutamate kinase [Dictyostelium discoideum AX4]|eukprot:XP_643952.2 acetylglutamate kinase [Dictyostelium discoideum AX4]
MTTTLSNSQLPKLSSSTPSTSSIKQRKLQNSNNSPNTDNAPPSSSSSSSPPPPSSTTLATPPAINNLVSPSNNPLLEHPNPTQTFPHFNDLKAGHALSKAYQDHHVDNGSNLNSLNSHLLQLPGIKSNLNIFNNNNNTNNNNNNEDKLSNNNNGNNSLVNSSGSGIISSSSNNNTPTKRSSSNTFQRVVDPDEEPLNVYSISGFLSKSLIFLISLLPSRLVEKLLLLFAWLQYELLKAKGRNLGGTQQSFSKLKKKRKSQKKKKNKLLTASLTPSSSSSTAAILSSIQTTGGPIPVAHSKSSPLVATKHQRRSSLSTSTPGLNSILKAHTKPPILGGSNSNSSNNIVGLGSSSISPLNGHHGTGIQHLNAIKDKLAHQQQKHLQHRIHLHQQAQQQAQQQQAHQPQQELKLFPTTSIPDQIPVTATGQPSTPTIKLTSVDSTPEFESPISTTINENDEEKSTEQQDHHQEEEEEQQQQQQQQPLADIDFTKINFKHRPSITELESSDSDTSNKSGITNLKVTFSDNLNNHLNNNNNNNNNNNGKMLDWNTYLNPNDYRLGNHQMSQENLMLQQHSQHLQKQQKQLQHHHNMNQSDEENSNEDIPTMGRHRSDSISVLPSLVTKPISEIRRVNSEQTLFQSSEDTLRFEANQQSKKEFEDFLRSVKDIKDVHNWLRNFSGSASKKIAIVKISRRILDTPYGIESAAASLCFMYKFGLYPIVIHGGMNDISKLPISQVVKERRMRSALLKEAIKKNGVGCSVLTPDICEIEPFIQPEGNGSGGDTSSDLSGDEIEYGQNDILPSGGLSMKIDSFDYDILTQVLDKGKIPVWDSVCESVDGVDIPINSDITTFELAKRIQPYKILFACNDGGILDSDHKAIPVVYMDQDYQTLIEADHTTNRRRVQLKQMKRIVDNLPSSTTVVVTSIENVTHQLLFPRLANGTIIKKSEENKVLIFDNTNYQNIDMDRLKELIENSFGKMLSTDYFDYLKDSLYRLYLCVSSDGEYNGCAIVTFKEPDYIPYLCKFCVKKSAQGLGLGDLVWRALQRDNEKLYWRSRNSNPLNPWYFQRCQGSFRADESFTIFWYGDDKFEDGSFLVETALSKPVTIIPNPTVS